MKPPYEVTSNILHFVAEISEILGQIKATQLAKPTPELRKKNRIKTIQASLEIEGNTLSIEQISAIFENKRVVGPIKDIKEVRNAVEAYDRIRQFNPADIRDFLTAHNILMKDLLGDTSGKFRTQAVGIMKGEQLAHLAPPAERVPGLMQELFDWVKNSPEHPLVVSCVFHYETEFIHPFMDGNGRIGRLWQTVILLGKYPVFEFLPVETIVRDRQQEYYDVLSRCDKTGNLTEFIEFMLGIMLQALDGLVDTANVSLDWTKRIEIFRSDNPATSFSRKDYLRFFKNISTATASRDLKKATQESVLAATGEKNKTAYRFR